MYRKIRKLGGFFYRKILLNLYYLPILILAYVITLLFRVTKSFYPIVFYRYESKRIGNQMLDLEVYLRRKQTRSLIISNEIPIFITDQKIANQFVFELAQRKIKIIRSKFLFKIMSKLVLDLGDKPPFLKLPKSHAPSPWFYKGSRQIFLNEKDEREGLKVLSSLGLSKDSKFVCFHSRGSSYLKSKYPEMDFSYHDYRDFSVKSYKTAIQELNRKGIWAIRIGINPDESVADFGPMTIDYSNSKRSDFGEIYLLSKCLFFIGTSSGICCVPAAFDIPSVITNSAPLGQGTVNSGDLYIPKKYWSKSKNRLLTVSEIIKMGADSWFQSEEFKKGEITLIENTSKEVYDVVLELYSRLEKKWIVTAQEKELQKKYADFWHENHAVKQFQATIGTQFLIDYKDLIIK